MADALYPKFKEGLVNAEVDLDVVNLRIALVTSGYAYNGAHDFLDDITNIVATSASFTTTSLTNGVVDFADVTISGLDTGETAAAYVLYVETGVAGTSRLIAYKDSATELPLAGSTGVDVVVQVNASGFFAL